jgi:hypothetical protein
MGNLLDIYRATVIICGIGLIIGTIEYWVISWSFQPNGIYPWDIIRLERANRWLSRIDAFGETGVRAVLGLRVLALALVLCSPPQSYVFSLGLAFLIGTTILLRWRTGYDEEGSDRMNTVVLITLFLCVNPMSTPFTLHAGTWFIALQSCLSYAASGIAKIASASWRNGDAVYRILSTKTYGMEPIGPFLQNRRALRLLLSWSVMSVEALFPLALVLPVPCSCLLLFCGLIFHVLVAFIMGFNCFFWAFVATYPSILAVAVRINGGELRL